MLSKEKLFSLKVNAFYYSVTNNSTFYKPHWL